MNEPENRSKIYADLHTHTHCSDGELSPTALVNKAVERGLCVLAVTDHDTVQGLEEAADEARSHALHFVSGVELSVSLGETEIHLLAYGVNPTHNGLRNHLRAMREARRERAWAMVERLRNEGIEVEDLQLRREIEETPAVGRPHVASALVRAGQVHSVQEAFERFIGMDGPGYVPKPEFSVGKALALIREAGGLGVLAHPGDWTSTEQIRELVKAGLQGLEVYHPSHRSSLCRYYKRLANGYELSATGGSDYHGRTPAEEQHFGTVGLTKPEWERFRASVA